MKGLMPKVGDIIELENDDIVRFVVPPEFEQGWPLKSGRGPETDVKVGKVYQSIKKVERLRDMEDLKSGILELVESKVKHPDGAMYALEEFLGACFPVEDDITTFSVLTGKYRIKEIYQIKESEFLNSDSKIDVTYCVFTLARLEQSSGNDIHPVEVKIYKELAGGAPYKYR